MHRKFQRELCRLRLETARSYVKLITDGQGPSTFMSGANVRINASVVGLGPAFQLKVQVRNSGTKSVAGLWLMLVYNRALYTVDPGTMMVPLLLPGQVTNQAQRVCVCVLRAVCCTTLTRAPLDGTGVPLDHEHDLR